MIHFTTITPKISCSARETGPRAYARDNAILDLCSTGCKGLTWNCPDLASPCLTAAPLPPMGIRKPWVSVHPQRARARRAVAPNLLILTKQLLHRTYGRSYQDQHPAERSLKHTPRKMVAPQETFGQKVSQRWPRPIRPHPVVCHSKRSARRLASTKAMKVTLPVRTDKRGRVLVACRPYLP